jgi:hypothetical protein
MELIPILSTIILVATIATFLLAIGAYILYKIRGRKSEEISSASTTTLKGELVTPFEHPVFEAIGHEQQGRTKQSLFIRQPEMDWRGERLSEIKSNDVFSPKLRPNSRQSQGKESPDKNQSIKQDQNYPGSIRRSGLKYTGESNISPKEEKDSGELKWR